MTRASIDDFSGKDLTAPTSVRVKRILSGLVNFYLYEREQAADFFYPAQEEDVELEMEYTKLLEEEGAIEEEIKFLEWVMSYCRTPVVHREYHRLLTPPHAERNGQKIKSRSKKASKRISK